MREIALPDLELIRILGHGSAGSVYLARRPSSGQLVALKHLRDAFASDVARARFEREARALAEVRHPCVLGIAEFLEIEGELLLITQYVEGTTLQEVLNDVQPELAISLVTQLAAGLDHVHAVGIVHRDIKPSNLLVSREGDCLLSDFGMARFVQDSLHGQRNGFRTRTGTILGTPAYIAPEVAAGVAAGQREIDQRADVYSLGVVAYRLLVGRPPFVGALHELLNAHLHETPPTPTELATHLPTQIDEPLLRALEKRPDDRYESAGEFARSLADATINTWPILSMTAARTALSVVVQNVAVGTSDDALNDEIDASTVDGETTLRVMPKLPIAKLPVFRPPRFTKRAKTALGAALAGGGIGIATVLLLQHH